jgi:hypothetical protein
MRVFGLPRLVTLCRVFGEFEFQLRDCSRMTGYSEVEQRTITEAITWLARRCDRVRIEKRTSVKLPAKMPGAKFQTLPRRGKRGRSCDSSHVS